MQIRRQHTHRRVLFRRLTQPSIPLLLTMVTLLLLFAAWFGRWDFQQFEAQLPQTFYAEEDGIYKVLDFDAHTLTYRLEAPGGSLPIVVGTYPYEVTAAGQIRLCRFGSEFETISLSFHRQGTVLTISPALTGTEKRETFFTVPPALETDKETE